MGEKEMKIRLIALDLDGTTLRDDKTLSERNKAAVLRAVERGVHVVVATGRAFSTIPEEVLALPGLEYAITSNGASVYHIPSASARVCHRLPREAVERILALVGRQAAMETFIDGVPYAGRDYVENPVLWRAAPEEKGDARSAGSLLAEERSLQEMLGYIQATRKPVEDIRAFMREHSGELDAIDLVVKNEEEKQRWWGFLKEQVPGIYITSSIPQLLEISHEHSGKKSGVAWLLGHYGLKPEEAAAFGDADNDVDMLMYVGAGIAMANASETAKQAADYVTFSNNEDGVAEGFEKFLNI